jgi:hypothetical protein
MSVESMAAALNLTGLKPSEKLVLIGIANHDGDGGAWPSIATLARYSGQSHRHVQRVIRELEGRGLVSTDLNEGGTLKTRDHERPNRYTLHLGGDTHVIPPGDTHDTPPVTPTTPEPSLEPSMEPEEPPYPPQAEDFPGASDNYLSVPDVMPPDIIKYGYFEQFWEQYPRHAGKPAALKAFRSALKRLRERQESTSLLFEGLERWCEHWKARNEPNFVPYPATWLNQDRWDDFPPRIAQNGRDRVGKSNEALIRVVQRRKGLQ